MLRSLLLKKILAFGNAALAVILALYVVVKLTQLPDRDIEVSALEAPVSEGNEIKIAEIPPRPAFEPIVESAIFGIYAQAKPKPPPPPPPPKPEKEVVTALPLKLIGTVVSVDDDPSGSAIIENRSGAAVKKTYFVGDEVMDGVVVKSIRRRMVLLDNRRANRVEQLFLETGDSNFRPVARSMNRPRANEVLERSNLAARIRASRSAVEGATRIFTFNRQELINEIEANYDELASTIDVQLVTDANGNVEGVKASNLSSTPFADKFGIQDGDVVQSVNGQQVDSLDRVYDIIEQNRNSSTFRVQLLRGGRPQVFTYHVR